MGFTPRWASLTKCARLHQARLCESGRLWGFTPSPAPHDGRYSWSWRLKIICSATRCLHTESGYGLRTGKWPIVVFPYETLDVCGMILSVSRGLRLRLLKLCLSKQDNRGQHCLQPCCVWRSLPVQGQSSCCVEPTPASGLELHITDQSLRSARR